MSNGILEVITFSTLLRKYASLERFVSFITGNKILASQRAKNIPWITGLNI